jgi:hypothetical protein
MVTHRRYVPPFQIAGLLAESGFENLRWIRDYDLATLGPIPEAAAPSGPFMILGEL